MYLTIGIAYRILPRVILYLYIASHSPVHRVTLASHSPVHRVTLAPGTWHATFAVDGTPLGIGCQLQYTKIYTHTHLYTYTYTHTHTHIHDNDYFYL